VPRALDILIALVALIVLSPVLLAAAIAIKLGSRGPVIYRQRRVGLDGREFELLKLRTMVQGSDPVGVGTVVTREDPRVTAAGRVLRRTSLDEIPNLINVLRGEMTVVGPRPPLAYELAHYKEWHRGRLAMKPGLTGLWQVSGRSTVPFDEMVMLDLYYIENYSLALDLKIMMRTIPVMLFGYGGY